MQSLKGIIKNIVKPLEAVHSTNERNAKGRK